MVSVKLKAAWTITPSCRVDPIFQLRGDGSGDPDSPCSGFREQSMPSKKRKMFERPKKHR